MPNLAVHYGDNLDVLRSLTDSWPGLVLVLILAPTAVYAVRLRFEPFDPDAPENRDMVFYHGRGCEQCRHTGYRGRIGVYELGQTFDAPWLSEDPVQGTIPGGECQVIDVTFDSTGLAAGDYFVDLLITSNDPDTPEIIVPVQMTVLESVTIDNVTFTADGLEVTFDSTVSGGAPFTYAWDFGDGYTSALEDPVHVYAAADCYMVTLTVSNQCGEATWGPTQVCVESPFLYYYLPLIMSNYPVQ